MHERAARRYRLGEALREALNADALSVVIQPIVDLESRSVTGGEFLSRWTHPEFGQVSPEDFVRVAEDENLSLQLGTHVLTALVRSVSGLPGSMTFSINVSPGDLMDAKFVDLLAESARSALALSRVIACRKAFGVSPHQRLNTWCTCVVDSPT